MPEPSTQAHGTAIEWTHIPGFKGETWNPVTGCDEVSPGCANCYARVFAERWRGIEGHPYEQGFDLMLHPGRLGTPLRWRKPRAVFVNSMSDLFHEEIPDEYVAEIFAVMGLAARHVFMVLTKRPERMHSLLRSWSFYRLVADAIARRGQDIPNSFIAADVLHEEGRFPNVWLGVTIENRRFTNRANLLRQTPAARRFISAEPLLGPLVPRAEDYVPELGDYGQVHPSGDWYWPDGKLVDEDTEPLDLTDIDWLIVGGESGDRHRRIDPQWARDLRDACLNQCESCSRITAIAAESGVEVSGFLDGCKAPRTRFFFKQWGGRRAKSGGRQLDGRTWNEIPKGEE